MIFGTIIAATFTRLFGDMYIKRYIDTTFQEKFSDKLTMVTDYLESKYKRLEGTQLVSAYEQEFKKAAISFIHNNHRITTGHQVELLVMDEKGQVVHAHSERHKGNISHLEYFQKMIDQKNGELTYNFKGHKYWMMFKTFNKWGWTISYSLKERDKYSVESKFRNLLLIVNLAVAIASIFLIIWLLRKVISPIEKLTTITHQISQGDFYHNIEVESSDEVGTLAQSFRSMQKAIFDKIVTIEKQNKLLEQQVVERTKANDLLQQQIKQREVAVLEKQKMQKQVFQASKLASIGELAAGVAHEINNPLSIVKGYLELLTDELESDGVLSKEYAELINTQNKSIDRIVEIINGLRNFSRIDAQKRQCIDVNETIDESIVLVKYIYEMQNVVFTVNLEATKCNVAGWVGKFQQVVMNCYSNARDAMKSRGGGTISVRSWNEKDMIKVEISDTGIGIPAENLDKIFNPFFSTKPIGEGTGLGMGISHAIVQQMQGTFTVKSVVDVGTSVTLSFPLVSQYIEKCPDLEIAALGQLSGSVLIVDDEEEIRSMLKQKISLFGIKVDVACDGLDAMQRVGENNYNIIVTDLQMPHMDGVELIKKLHEQKVLESTSLFLIAGGLSLNITEEQNEFISPLIKAYINKPFSFSKIHAEMQDVLT